MFSRVCESVGKDQSKSLNAGEGVWEGGGGRWRAWGRRGGLLVPLPAFRWRAGVAIKCKSVMRKPDCVLLRVHWVVNRSGSRDLG